MSVGGLRAFDGTFFHPRHQRAELGSGLLNRMLFAFFEQSVVSLVAALVFRNPFAREFAGLNVLERGLHAFLHAGVNDLRADADDIPLGR